MLPPAPRRHRDAPPERFRVADFCLQYSRAMTGSGNLRGARRRRTGAVVTATLACAAVGAAGSAPAGAVAVAQHPLPAGASAATGIASVAGGLAVTRAVQSSTVLDRIATAPFAAGPL